MSNIFLKKGKGNTYNNKGNESNLVKSYDDFNSSGYIKHFPSANKEWSNSIYAYNKNSLKSLPIYNLIVTNLIKSYFNLYDFKGRLKKSKRMSRRMRIRLKRLSFNKVFVNKAELKHTSSKVVITSNIFNGQERHLRYNLHKIGFIKRERDLKKKKLKRIRANKKLKLIKELKLTKYFTNIRHKSIFKNKEKIKNRDHKVFDKIYDNRIKSLNLNKLHKVYMIRIKKFFQKTIRRTINAIIKNKKDLKINFLNNKLLLKYIISRPKYKRFIKRYLKREMFMLYLKNLLYFNRSKFYKTYLLNNFISKIYDKKVEFNFVNLKYFYLNSDIFAESIYTKLKNRKNKPVRVLNKSLRSIKLPKKEISYVFGASEKRKYYKTLWLNNFDSDSFISEIKDSSFNKDVLNELLQEMYLYKKNNQIKETLNLIRYKAVNGVWLKASGRLSKRLTAARSISKIRHKGGLKNIESSSNGLSSAMIRNHISSNIQYSKENSKTRNGSFGIKVWISGK